MVEMAQELLGEVRKRTNAFCMTLTFFRNFLATIGEFRHVLMSFAVFLKSATLFLKRAAEIDFAAAGRKRRRTRRTRRRRRRRRNREGKKGGGKQEKSTLTSAEPLRAVTNVEALHGESGHHAVPVHRELHRIHLAPLEPDLIRLVSVCKNTCSIFHVSGDFIAFVFKTKPRTK